MTEPVKSLINPTDPIEHHLNDENQAMLAAIIDSSDDAIISKNLQGIITSWNPAATRIFGYTPEEIIGRHITLLIPTAHRAEEDYIISRIASGLKVDHIKTTRITKDRREIPMSLTVSPIRDSSGKIIGASKIARDISVEAQALERQNLLAAIIDSSGDAIISKNLKGVITSWNIGAERLFGYHEDEMIGKHITKLIPLTHRPEEEYIISRIALGEKIDHFQTIRLTKFGTEIAVSISVSPIKDKNGRIIGASKIARDVSEQVSETRKLQELNQAKDEFIGIASHELKTPLTSIKAYMQVLERKLSGDSNYPFITKALQQVNKLSLLIGDLLDVSKIQAGRMHFSLGEFDLNALITECAETMQQTAVHKIVYKPADKEIAVMADRQRLEQVIVNLVSNAVKYSPQAEKVIISCEQYRNEVMVCVQDFGIGIQLSDQEKIFSRFYRAESLPSSFSGLGIGLYISHEIIHRHQGKMWVQSEPGKGSIFCFKIPYYPRG